MDFKPNANYSKMLLAAIAGEALRKYCNEVMAELQRIRAKQILKMRLTAKERAIWTLYGKETK